MHDAVRVTVDGRELRIPYGTTAAAAILLAGSTGFRQSVTGQPRGPLCGMGICFECSANVDGQPNRRTCQLLVSEGMVLRTSC